MPASLAERRYVVLVLFTVDPDQAEEFNELMTRSVDLVRSGPGNHCYDFNRDPADPNRFMLYEIFDDEAAWEVHHARPEIAELLRLIKPMQIGKPQRSVWSAPAAL
ncbi:quinol monooxygenase YgiN [Bosea sp. AK1]|nr:quinol monooxygenase YgiN [Bosea sp. AK1]